MADVSKLFTPIEMGELTLPNRILMAPLTRNRAQPDGTPSPSAETYYAQRASAGLIFTEATQISDLGKGYLNTPGIYTEDHVAAWRKITDAVHAGGGRIFSQLWHVGRISHVSLLPDGDQPVGPSNKAAGAQTFTEKGFEDVSTPRALDEAGIKAVIADYAHAAKMALKAGFDGIEIHAANGYLLDQFLQDGVNDRTDAYGGSIENRARLLMEVLDAVEAVYPKGRIGVRLSPLGQFNDMGDSDPEVLFTYLYKALDARKLAYLHVVEQFPGSTLAPEESAMMKRLRAAYNGFYIANGGYGRDESATALANDHADALAIGRPFIANPDLPRRYLLSADLNEPDGDTFYGGSEKGYTDYPALQS
ncbi:MAG: alkene reductase [Pseudomonadota bacterium]